MKYSRFELLVIIAGTITIAGNIAFSLRPPIVWEEIAGQLLLLCVLVTAAHWGRNGGFIAALIASLAYILIRIPTVTVDRMLTADVTTLVLVHVLTYGLIGIAGGELFGRMKYIFARLETTSGIDEWSQVYNQRFTARALENVVGQHVRYQTPFSLVTVRISPNLTRDLKISRQRSLIRGLATYLRNDIRIVDETGRLEDGRFLVILPHTPKTGGQVVSERLHAGVCETLGAREDSVSVELHAAPEDLAYIQALLGELTPEERANPQTAPSLS